MLTMVIKLRTGGRKYDGKIYSNDKYNQKGYTSKVESFILKKPITLEALQIKSSEYLATLGKVYDSNIFGLYFIDGERSNAGLPGSNNTLLEVRLVSENALIFMQNMKELELTLIRYDIPDAKSKIVGSSITTSKSQKLDFEV